MPKKNETVETVELNEIKKAIRSKIEERFGKFGGMVKFLESPKGKELGGMKIRPYLYDSGANNFEVISALCEYFGIGSLSRKLVVSRKYFYSLSKTIPTNKKPSQNV